MSLRDWWYDGGTWDGREESVGAPEARAVLRDAIIDAWVRDEPPYPTATGKFGPLAGVFPALNQ